LNPCPCGHLGDKRHACRCSEQQIRKYRARVSGPLLDRIDLHVEAPALGIEDLQNASAGESSGTMRTRIATAREVQRARFGDGVVNARLSHRQIRDHCALDATQAATLRRAMEKLNLSARAYDRVLKVARTLADLAGEPRIATPHLLEAIQYRSLDRA